MSHADDADAYLKRVQNAAQQQFRHGFMTAAVLDPESAPVVVVDVTSTNRPGALPMKKKAAAKRRRGSDDDDDSDDAEEKKKGATAVVPSSQVMHPAAASAVAPSSGAKRVSLLDRYFPGNLLKDSSLEVALSPPVAVVEKTVSAVAAMRERVVLLRSTVDDADELMTGETAADRVGPDGMHVTPSEDAVVKVVCADNWKGIRDLLTDGTRRKARSMSDLRCQLEQVRRRKARVEMPAIHSVKLWHEYLDLHGPETGYAPSLSDVLWTSAACTTLLFSLVAQRFQRTVQQCEAASRSVSRLEVVSAPDEAGHDHAATINHTSWLAVEQPRLASELTPEVASLLVFLRCLMPATATVGETFLDSAGFGVWLFCCLCALDTPLDPDTDRLAHSLFRSCCDHLRTVGKALDVRGETRGELWTRLDMQEQPLESSPTAAKAYVSVQDIGSEEVRALWTLIIVLAKFFRQNQGGLITL